MFIQTIVRRPTRLLALATIDQKDPFGCLFRSSMVGHSVVLILSLFCHKRYLTHPLHAVGENVYRFNAFAFCKF